NHSRPKASRTARAVSGQHREEADRELPEVGDVDVAVVIEIECSDEAGLTAAQIECAREECEVGYIDVPVAVDVAIEAVETLRVAEGEVVAGRAVAVAVESESALIDLACQDGQRVAAIFERAEFG